MRIAICGRNLDDLRGLLAGLPIEVVSTDPELVISHGGDGALLGAERLFPGIPKLPLRDHRHNPKCADHDERRILEAMVAGTLPMTAIDRLVATTDKGESICGINDVFINKENICCAVRYRLWIDGRLDNSQVVGDGLVVATPFGSTGYYRSITKSLFRVGIGLAFNNSTEPLDHQVVGGNSVIEVEILRGPAVLLADNDPRRIHLHEGSRVRISRDPRQTKVLGLDGFRCRRCFAMRADGTCLSALWTED